MVTVSEQGNPLFSLFPFLENCRDMKQKSRTFRKLQVLHPTDIFKGGLFFFFLLWSVRPVIYLMVLPESAGVVGFAGKAPLFCSPERTKQNKSHARELAQWDFCPPRLPHAPSLPPHLQRNAVLWFVCTRHCFRSGVSFSPAR